MRSFGFFLKETIEGIHRHSVGSLVTFLQVFISLFFLGMFLIIIINVNHFVQTFLNNLEMVAFLSDDLTQTKSVDLIHSVQQLQGVRNVKYVSKDEAIDFMEKQSKMDLKNIVRQNPLPASLRITVDNPGTAANLAPTISQLDGVKDVRYGDDLLQAILPWAYAFELGSFFIAIFLAGVTLITIMNTVRLAILTRKREIRIMQLVGATSWFIRLPFLIEGLIYGIGGSALALALLGIGYELTLKGIASRGMMYLGMLDLNTMMSNLATMMIILGVMIAVIASLIAVGKHLEEDLYRPVPQQGVVA